MNCAIFQIRWNLYTVHELDNLIGCASVSARNKVKDQPTRVYRYLGIAAEDRSIPAASGVDDLDEEPSTMTESLADDALPEPPSLFEVNIFAAGKGVDASVLAACRALRGCGLGLSITTEPVTADDKQTTNVNHKRN